MSKEKPVAGLDLPKMSAHLSDDYLLAKDGDIDLFGLRAPYRKKPIIFAVKGICFTLGIELMLGRILSWRLRIHASLRSKLSVA